MKFLSLFCLAAILLLQGCAVTTKRAPEVEKPSARKIYDQAVQDLKAGQTQSAAGGFKTILKDHSRTALADDAAISMGNIHFKTQNYDRALEYYLMVVDSDVRSPRENEARYLAARSLYFLDRFDETIGLLETITQSNEKISPKLMRFTHQLLYRTYLQQSDYLDVLRSLNQLIGMDIAPDQKYLFRQKAQQFIEKKIDWESLNALAEDDSLPHVQGFAFYSLAQHYAEMREFDQAAESYEKVIQMLPETAYSDEAQRFLADMEARKIVEPKTIGVILPLSGRQSKVAYRALKGIQMALGIYGDRPSEYRLAVLDSEGNPDVARRAVERLVLEDHVIAIIGSLLSKTAEAVSKTAHNFGVPSITLSQKSNLTEIGNSVFRNALTSEMQVSHLVKVAMEQYGIKRFGILYPNDRYGVEYANLFWDHVQARGGEVTAAQPYKSSETDFKGPIRRMVGTFYIDDRLDEYKHYVKEWQKENIKYISRRTPPEDLLPPVIDFEALFIPDGTKALAQIAPMLRYNDVSDVMLLGTNLWNSKTLLRRVGSLAEKTLFVDALLTSQAKLEKSSFFKKYQDTFEERPGQFEIRGFDTAYMLRTLLDSGLTERTQVIDRLVQIKNFPGIAGPLTVTSQREFALPIESLTVKNSSIQKVK